MHIVHVHIHIRPDSIGAFERATLENARASVEEAGIARFDVIQQADDPTHYVLVEVYRSPEDQLAHRETAHYKAWRETVEPMMAEPRNGVIFGNIFPPDGDW